MSDFAIIESGIVVNTVTATDSSHVAINENQQCVEYTLSNPAVIGLKYENGAFEQKVPYVPEPEYDEEGNFLGLKPVPVYYNN